MEKIISNNLYVIIYNTEYDAGNGFYFIVRDLKNNGTVAACTGFNTSEEALTFALNQANRKWLYWREQKIKGEASTIPVIKWHDIYDLLSKYLHMAF
jgi:hypothetical protein